MTLVVNAGAASKDTYPAQHFSLKGIKDIKIIGVRGTLKMRGRSSKLMSLKVQHTSNRKTADDWNLSFEKRGSTLFLR